MRTSDEQELYPIAVLVDELKNEDTQLRLNAIRNLGTIAMALGPQRTRDELIPFLNDSISDDEILLAVADELADFTEYVGGPEYAHYILGPLEHLASIEEVLVRDKAVESLCKIGCVLSTSQTEHYFVPLIKRLTSGEWFTCRISAAGLYATAYPKCTSEQQEELRSLFTQLMQDETPMVRRSVAKTVADFVKQVSKDQLLNQILPMFIKLTNDDQDTVRLLTVEGLVKIAHMLSQEERKQYLLPILKSLGQDRSWKVRYMVASHFSEICEAFGDTVSREDMAALFLALIKDTEGEVKVMTIGQTPAFAKMIDEVIIVDKLLPCIKDLVLDTNQHVRAAVATHISGLAPILGKDLTIEYLLPLFLQLLKDDFPDVRLNIISKLQNVNQAIIEYIPLLASELGVAFFDEKLLSLCLSWLGDAVFSIRDAATTNLKQLVDIFGCEWAKNTIIPQVMKMSTNENYLYRMTTLFAFTTMGPSLTTDIIKESVLPTVLALVDDPIPNVRFNVAKSLEVLTPMLRQNEATNELVQSKVAPVLQKLNSDADGDVRWFAERALLTGKMTEKWGPFLFF
ncbi:armadillo-type protein [Radiomyces spectabilis]|uniref:armadillo-type protein n=1 Tax=Radiomyces spectabilis TaxID=64574 RepID=UPI00221E49CC|nr:armadillo-type protein [Radiomyces spectabilis]KAI8372723.1 armadillo-type protein [Radiomyces spectabilis]